MRAIKTVIPFKPDNPKSRLSSVFSEDERKHFVGLSLLHVLGVLKKSGIREAEILTKSPPAPKDEKLFRSLEEKDFRLLITPDARELNEALNAYLKKSEVPVLIVMADLALLKKEDIDAMTGAERKTSDNAAEKKKSVRIAPGKDGGTNMMFIEAPDRFEVNYYGESFKKHKAEADKKNLTCEVYTSFSAASDMDEPEDLEDILMHGNEEIRTFVSAVRKKASAPQKSRESKI